MCGFHVSSGTLGLEATHSADAYTVVHCRGSSEMAARLAGGALLAAAATLVLQRWRVHRRADADDASEPYAVLHDVMTPEGFEAARRRTLPGSAAQTASCCVDGDAGSTGEGGSHVPDRCCQGAAAACGCAVPADGGEALGSRAASAASSGALNSRNMPGLPKEEYRRLKKAGLLPPKDPAQAAATPRSSKDAAIGHEAVKGRLGGMVVLYASQTGNAQSLATDLHEDASEKGFAAELADMASFDFASFVQQPPPLPVLVIICSTWTDGVPPPKAQAAFKRLFSGDWTATALARVRYGVFGLGNSLYGDNFCKAARTLDARLAALGAQRVCARGENDDDKYCAETYPKWKDALWVSQGARLMGNSVQFIDNPSDADSDDGESAEEDELDSGDDYDENREDGIDALLPSAGATNCGSSSAVLGDVEDLGSVAALRPRKNRKSVGAGQVGVADKPKKMLNPSLEASLTKQGYKLVGSHSGVKLCRWTKAMLRGRGGCYKHTFYGISSYQCMEATPSLACANKCVFCWRHHKNPVGTSWRWETDDAQLLVDGFMAKHRAMIKEMRGLPGVLPERLHEAYTIRHCALSLVGEPIIYPEINRFIQLLHGEGISSFLVSNAQFPAQMEALVPCTQLYVSIDASNAADLKRVDRPLFKDYWQRFLDCIDILSRKASSLPLSCSLAHCCASARGGLGLLLGAEARRHRIMPARWLVGAVASSRCNAFLLVRRA